jgi:two-component system response regulator EvgA
MPARNHPGLAAIPLILIVDDNGPKRYALGRTLQQHGFDVIEAGTGEDALKRCSAEHPDLVLLDVNLPDLDGFSVAQRITANQGAPAVVLTSSRDSSDFGPLVAGSGARGFISKGELSGAAIAELL